VLHEASDDRKPLLERVKFLAIAGNNLDEFFMKRIGALKQKASSVGVDAEGDADYRHLLEFRSGVISLLDGQAKLYTQTLLPELARHGIRIVAADKLTETQTEAARQFFDAKCFRFSRRSRSTWAIRSQSCRISRPRSA
jgi:polyphosphate kinase